MTEWKPFDLTWGRSIYYCSECEESVDLPTVMGKPIYKYCPMCGAKMNADRKTEPQKMCDADCNEDCTECAKEWQDWKDQMWAEAVVTEPQTEREGE